MRSRRPSKACRSAEIRELPSLALASPRERTEDQDDDQIERQPEREYPNEVLDHRGAGIGTLIRTFPLVRRLKPQKTSEISLSTAQPTTT